MFNLFKKKPEITYKYSDEEIRLMTKKLIDLQTKFCKVSHYTISDCFGNKLPHYTDVDLLEKALLKVYNAIDSGYNFNWEESEEYLITKNKKYKLYSNSDKDGERVIQSSFNIEDGSYTLHLLKQIKNVEYEYTQKFDAGEWKKARYVKKCSYALNLEECFLINEAKKALKERGINI